MNFRRNKRPPVEIALIPMIDVLLVLLFFFMLATTFRTQSQLHINLPQASGNNEQSLGKMINLIIDANGIYSLTDSSGKLTPIAKQDLLSLKTALAEITLGNTNLPFVINADGKTPHQAVVGAMDVANQLGIHQISFAIKTTNQK